LEHIRKLHFQMKGQAAMEFLMTYGWAILVVLAAIGAVAYFGILQPGQLLPDKCAFVAGFDCIDKPVVNFNTGQIQFAIKNDLGIPVNYVGATITGDGDCSTLSVTSVNLMGNNSVDLTATTPFQPSEKAIFTIVCGGDMAISGDLEANIDVSYTNIDTSLVHSVKGILRAKRT